MGERTSTNATEARFFDDYIEANADFNPFADRAWANLRRRFEEHVVSTSPLDLLDVGCGTGQSRQLYRARAGRNVGIDLSANAVRRAATLFPDDAWGVADATRLPFADASFDAVAFSSVLSA